jgi:hypothetical protein
VLASDSAGAPPPWDDFFQSLEASEPRGGTSDRPQPSPPINGGASLREFIQSHLKDASTSGSGNGATGTSHALPKSTTTSRTRFFTSGPSLQEFQARRVYQQETGRSADSLADPAINRGRPLDIQEGLGAVGLESHLPTVLFRIQLAFQRLELEASLLQGLLKEPAFLSGSLQRLLGERLSFLSAKRIHLDQALQDEQAKHQAPTQVALGKAWQWLRRTPQQWNDSFSPLYRQLQGMQAWVSLGPEGKAWLHFQQQLQVVQQYLALLSRQQEATQRLQQKQRQLPKRAEDRPVSFDKDVDLAAYDLPGSVLFRPEERERLIESLEHWLQKAERQQQQFSQQIAQRLRQNTPHPPERTPKNQPSSEGAYRIGGWEFRL